VTLLLTHPDAEDLGRFVEGTLDDPERTAVVDHIADCDDCRMVVVDAAEFIEPAKKESHNWWIGIAASLIVVAAIAGLTYRQFHDLERDVKKEYASVPTRPLEARLSGYQYVPRVVNRGAEEEKDIQLQIMQGAAADLTELQGTDAKTLHAKGIGFLLGDDDKKKSIGPLQAAAERDPNNAKYESDLAAALIAAAQGDRPTLEKALAACDRALRIDPRSPEALFNRAVAIELLDRPDAAAAYERYLAVDSTSRWATEVRGKLELLRPLP
jgi:tetratricopeptide (TPR) repeat protein